MKLECLPTLPGKTFPLDSPYTNGRGLIKLGTFNFGSSNSQLIPGIRVRVGVSKSLNYSKARSAVDAHADFRDEKCKWKCSDHQSYTVAAVDGSLMQIFLDSRSRPEWLWVRRGQVRERMAATHPVYSPHGVAPTIRSFQVPLLGNGFLICGNTGLVRLVDGRCLWELHELPACCATDLKSAGYSDIELGALSGSSIPMSMAISQTSRLKHRIEIMHSIDGLMSSTGIPWGHFQSPSVPDH